MRHRIYFLALSLASLLSLALPSLLATPVWEANPTGNTGALKSQIQTGGSYNAHSGNATRVVNDLQVHGALGDYGLDFTRYWNSVHNDYDNDQAEWPLDFGMSGWSHSWRWTAVEGHDGPHEVPGTNDDDGKYITSITITFPDGHTSKYKIERCGARPGRLCASPNGTHGPPYSEWERTNMYNWPYAGPGVNDHICDMREDGTEFRLCRADGGSVYFKGGPGDYRAEEVIDPHGFKTTLEYEDGHLKYVRQEGGRYLEIKWSWYTNAGWAIEWVKPGSSDDSKAVTYTYTRAGPFFVLWKVTYPHEVWETQIATAVYSYGGCFGAAYHQECSSPSRDYPLLKRASDPHFAGPMTVIRYDYFGGGCSPPQIHPELYLEYVPAQPYGIAAEKSDSNLLVSGFQLTCESGDRWETNGLGGQRRFYFGRAAQTAPPAFYIRGYNLGKITDFTRLPLTLPWASETLPCPQGVPCQRQNFHISNNMPDHIWDARNNEIKQFPHPDDFSGEPYRIEYPGGGITAYNRTDATGSADPDRDRIPNTYNHWLFSKTDENGNITAYRRDERRRITDIYYYDNLNNLRATESYSYNGLNQVLTHTLASGAVQYYEYDDQTHLLTREMEFSRWPWRRHQIYS